MINIGKWVEISISDVFVHTERKRVVPLSLLQKTRPPLLLLFNFLSNVLIVKLLHNYSNDVWLWFDVAITYDWFTLLKGTPLILKGPNKWNTCLKMDASNKNKFRIQKSHRKKWKKKPRIWNCMTLPNDNLTFVRTTYQVSTSILTLIFTYKLAIHLAI